MKILVVHNAYQTPGGEDAVVAAEVGLLRRAGHEVHVYRRHNDDIARQPPLRRLRTAAEALWNAGAMRELAMLCDGVLPDLAHIHNTFPLISPAFFPMLAGRGIPLVQTLHNFRLLCPQAMLLREGRICEDCVGRQPWRAVTRRCYRGSTAQSAVAAGVVALHRSLGTYTRHVTQFIALSKFCRDKFVQGGLPGERIRIKPHFTEALPLSGHVRGGGLFVGRLSQEKGLALLADALDRTPQAAVRIVGQGPLEAEVQARHGGRFLGRRARPAVQLLLQSAAYLVAPSVCYETFGMNLIEAFAAGTPVIASDHGSYAELVRHGENGLLFAPGDAASLARALAWAEAHPAAMRRMGENARADYEARYTPHINYRLMMDIYEHAIRSKHREQATAPARMGAGGRH